MILLAAVEALGFEEEVDGEEVVKLLMKVEDNLEKSRARLIAALFATDIGVSL